MIYLIDSWVWIEYFLGTKRGEAARKYIESAEEKIIMPINVFEVYYKILSLKGRIEAEKFTEFMSRKAALQEISLEVIKLAAELKNEKKLAMADALVLSTAIKNNATIVTGDPDFKKITEVKTIMI